MMTGDCFTLWRYFLEVLNIDVEVSRRESKMLYLVVPETKARSNGLKDPPSGKESIARSRKEGNQI
jgi:hypothetical protein